MKIPDFSNRMNKELDGISSLSKILNSYNLTNQLNSLSMTQAMLKGMVLQQPHWINSYNEISKYNLNPIRFEIPESTIQTINSIGNHNQRLFESLNSSISISQKFNNYSKILNLQNAFISISTQLAKLAASQKKWDILEDFEEITNEAVSINERIIDEEGLSQENFEILYQFLNRIEIKIENKEKSSSAVFLKLLTIIGFILALTSEIRNWTPKPNYATQEQVETIIAESINSLEERLKEKKEYRLINRKCNVYLKPKLKTVILAKLEKDMELIVLNVHHKWIYVSYVNPNDGLPQTGWVMKKYTEKIK